MKRSELEKYLGKEVRVHFKKGIMDNVTEYYGTLTECTSIDEKNLYYCKGVFSKEVRFRSSYILNVKEVDHNKSLCVHSGRKVSITQEQTK